MTPNKLSRLIAITLFLIAASALWTACGDDGSEVTGAACASTDECYPNVDHADLSGDVRCLSDNVPDGYCTHTCETDTDCCAIDGECPDGLDFVCSSLENQTEKFCFLSCDGSDDAYCQDNVSDVFTCRSTGGGSENRKVCLP